MSSLTHTKLTFKLSIGWHQSHHQNITSNLQNCSNQWHLKQILALMTRTRLIEDTFLASRVILFLTTPSNATNMSYARRVFDMISYPNVFTWNSMIRGYTQNHLPKEALHLYKQMVQNVCSPDGHTYPVVLKACALGHMIGTGESIHGSVAKHGFVSDMYVVSAIVNLYATFGQIDIARGVFDGMPDKDVVVWTSMISGYVQSNRSEEAFCLFEEMTNAGIEPNKVTLVSLATACGQSRELNRANWLHSCVVKHHLELDVVIGNSLISMYSKCRSISRSLEVFENMQVKNQVSWNAIVGGLVNNREFKKALFMFQDMMRLNMMPNVVTFVSLLTACAQLGDIQQGEHIHALINEQSSNASDIFVENALVNMYASCGDIESALGVFKEMPEQDVISWTAMISGYVQVNRFIDAFTLFKQMRLSGVEPNEITLVGLLSACAQIGALKQGRQTHCYITENNIKKDVHLDNALINMYAKCGSIETGLHVFKRMIHKDVYSWNVMIGGLAVHGRGREATELFDEMQRVGNVKPDRVTFLSVLCACAHSGMVQEGHHFFNLMSYSYEITPELEHYGCIIDLLTRVGHLHEAHEFMLRMPVEPSHVMWGSLLAACRTHGETELAERAAEGIKMLMPDDEVAHVLLSNVYAEVGRWDDVGRIRTIMDAMEIRKSPGFSSVLC